MTRIQLDRLAFSWRVKAAYYRWLANRPYCSRLDINAIHNERNLLVADRYLRAADRAEKQRPYEPTLLEDLIF